VGTIVAESFARVGIEQIMSMDFDTVELVNLDRLLHAGPRDAALGRSKIEVLARALRRSATAENPHIIPVDRSTLTEVRAILRHVHADQSPVPVAGHHPEQLITQGATRAASPAADPATSVPNDDE
jgi:ThiF family